MSENPEDEVLVRLLLSVPGLVTSAHNALVGAYGYAGAVEVLRSGDRAALGDAVRGSEIVAALVPVSGNWHSVEVAAAELDRSMRRIGCSLWLPTDPRWEGRFGRLATPPAALFVQGDLGLLGRPPAAIVGTRSATPSGREMARRLGVELSEAGASVVSGLALGIDAQAHAGALTASDPGPIGVVGCGLDVIYPRQHAELWGRVAREGLLVSEYPPGTRPTSYSFPARNRIIAALADVVVVVESAVGGGSLITAMDAQRIGRTVMVVPGSPLHSSCAGSNALLRSGQGDQPVFACLESKDVLSWLMLDQARNTQRDRRPTPSLQGQLVLELVGWDELTTSQVIDRVERPAAGVARELDDLECAGWLECRGGRWSRVGHHGRQR